MTETKGKELPPPHVGPKANNADRLVLDVADDVRILEPCDLSGRIMKDVKIPVRYIGMAERGEIGRRHHVVEARMQTSLETIGYYAEIVRAAIVHDGKYQWKGIVDRDGNEAPCTNEAKDKLPAHIADQVIDLALANIQKEALSAAVREALSTSKEASGDGANPTSR